MDLRGIMNSQEFQLSLGGHRNAELQADWKAFGAAAFAIEVLETLKPGEDGSLPTIDDLRAREKAWFDKLRPYGDRGYHPPPRAS